MERIPTPNSLKTPDQVPELFRSYPEVPDNFRAVRPAYWSPYKSAVEKLKYETNLPTIIQPFLRSYFHMHTAEMAEVQQCTLSDYTTNLKNAWAEHVGVNAAIDTFLTYEVRSPFGQWSLGEWNTAKRLLRAGMKTDHTKVMYSSGLKTKLDSETKKLVQKYGAQDPNFETMLLTPSFPTFYEQRDIEQKKYVLSVLDGMPDQQLKDLIISKYHGGDPGVFEARLEGVSSQKSMKELRADIQKVEESFRERSVKKGYFLSERPDLKEFEELLKFDNTTEYELTYSLKGLPDLFLREEVLKRLTTLGKLPADASVFGLTLKDFETAINSAVADVRNHFTTVLRPYRQNYDTCGTACVMSILNRKGMRMDEDAELRIWEMVGKPYNFPGGLAWVLLRNGFKVTYVQDSHVLLSAQNPEFAAMSPVLVSAAKTYVDLHEKAVEQGLEFQVSDWGYDRVRAEIERGNVCMLYLHISDTMSHVVLANGVKNESIEIIDPMGSMRTMSKEELDQRIVHPMGKRLLIVKKLPNDLLDVLDRDLSDLGH